MENLISLDSHPVRGLIQRLETMIVTLGNILSAPTDPMVEQRQAEFQSARRAFGLPGGFPNDTIDDIRNRAVSHCTKNGFRSESIRNRIHDAAASAVALAMLNPPGPNQPYRPQFDHAITMAVEARRHLAGIKAVLAEIGEYDEPRTVADLLQDFRELRRRLTENSRSAFLVDELIVARINATAIALGFGQLIRCERGVLGAGPGISPLVNEDTPAVNFVFVRDPEGREHLQQTAVGRWHNGHIVEAMNAGAVEQAKIEIGNWLEQWAQHLDNLTNKIPATPDRGLAKGANASAACGKGRGRPTVEEINPQDAADRKRAVDAWKTKRHANTHECARALGYRADGETPFDATFVRAAIDAARKPPRKKPAQK